MDDLLLVMSNGKPGREADHRDYLQDMRRVPGIASGALYALTEADATARWNVAAFYPLSEPVGTVLNTIFARAGGDGTPLTDAIDPESLLILAASPIGPRICADEGEDRADGVRYVVLTNATEGDDDVFNAWYSDQHISDVLAVPGFIAAQRFTIAPETAGPWRYLALYEIAPETLEASMAELSARSGGERMFLSPTLSMEDLYATLFSPASSGPATLLP